MHGRVVRLVPQRAWRGPDRLYEVATRLDTVHEDGSSSSRGNDADLSPASIVPAAAAGRDVTSPFYHELEPTTELDPSTPCY